MNVIKYISPLTLLLFIVFFITSCFEPVSGPKPTSTIIKGTILQIGTLTPVEGALIELSVRYSTGAGGGSITYAVDSAYTNEDGVYYLETEIDPTDNPGSGGSFQITELSHPNYYSGTSTVEASLIFHLQEVTKNAELTPHAYINLHLVNSPDIDGDYFKIHFISTVVNHELSPNEAILDTLLQVSGENLLNQIVKRKLNPSPSEIEKDSLYLIAFTTTDITFEY